MHLLHRAGVAFGPGKAANVGGVATSVLEMQQNATRQTWPPEETAAKLTAVMRRIHHTCYETADRFGTPGNYVTGANIAAFERLATGMLTQGLV